jgi:putative peptidoglycan lipid II flippase
MILLAGPIVRLVLAHGEFTLSNADTTANTLIAFLFGLPAFSLFLFAMRGFYAQRDTRLPFYINASETILALVIAFVVVDRFGVVGLGASGSIAYSVFAVVALFLLHHRIGRFFDASTIVTIAKLVLSSAVMGLAVWAFLTFTDLGDLPTFLCAAAIGIGVYATLLVLLRVDEAKLLVTRLLRR